MFLALLLLSIESAPVSAEFRLPAGRGHLTGRAAVVLNGTVEKARVSWDGFMKNEGPDSIAFLKLCLVPRDEAGGALVNQGDRCLVEVTATAFAANGVVTFKSKANVRLGAGRLPLNPRTLDVSIAELRERPRNVRALPYKCPILWASLIRPFAERQFKPTILDVSTHSAAFSHEAGRVDRPASLNLIKAYTASPGYWDSFRIASAAAYLKDLPPNSCEVEIKVEFDLFGTEQLVLQRPQWFRVRSSFAYEANILESLEAAAIDESRAQTSKATEGLPDASMVQACRELYAATADKKRADLTLREEQRVSECQKLGLFTGK